MQGEETGSFKVLLPAALVLLCWKKVQLQKLPTKCCVQLTTGRRYQSKRLIDDPYFFSHMYFAAGIATSSSTVFAAAGPATSVSPLFVASGPTPLFSQARSTAGSAALLPVVFFATGLSSPPCSMTYDVVTTSSLISSVLPTLPVSSMFSITTSLPVPQSIFTAGVPTVEYQHDSIRECP